MTKQTHFFPPRCHPHKRIAFTLNCMFWEEKRNDKKLKLSLNFLITAP